MKNILLVIGLLLGCAFGVVVVQSYQAANAGRLLAEAFFDARPPGGYGTQRVLTALETTDSGASILRQGVRYHQQADYDLALVAFRAYFADNPVVDDQLPATLAASAAMASGAYADARVFLTELPAEDVTKLWLQALLELREENLGEAKVLLTRLEETKGNPYPATTLISRLP